MLKYAEVQINTPSPHTAVHKQGEAGSNPMGLLSGRISSVRSLNLVSVWLEQQKPEPLTMLDWLSRQSNYIT